MTDVTEMTRITRIIPQLRTTDLAATIAFYTLHLETDDVAAFATALKMRGVALAEDVHETAWQTRECVIQDDQGHTLYFGRPLEKGLPA